MKAELTRQERARRLTVVKNGRDSEFWKLLAESIKELIAHHKAFLATYESSGIAEKDRENFNRYAWRIAALEEVLAMPDVIIQHNTKILDKILNQTREQTQKFVSLVEQFNKK